MDMYKLENEILSISIAAKGAELQRIYNKQTDLDYLWDGNATFWGRHAPVLFPIVGALKNDTYTYNDKTYHLSRHGFARDNDFVLVQQTETTVAFSLCENEETLKQYPFHFELIIKYTLIENKIIVEYEVHNKEAEDTMFFSIGAHPAFCVPMTGDTHFDDYFLSFKEFENTGRYPLTETGLLKEDPIVFLQSTDELPLQKSLFYNDALVFKTLESNVITLENNKTKHYIAVEFDDFPYMGIWSARDANFVCIEPWLGIADNENASGKIEEKEGMQTLNVGQVFKAQWSIDVG